LASIKYNTADDQDTTPADNQEANTAVVKDKGA
jgi:hypothetical protein